MEQILQDNKKECIYEYSSQNPNVLSIRHQYLIQFYINKSNDHSDKKKSITASTMNQGNHHINTQLLVITYIFMKGCSQH
jgi:hypothetical protein